MSDFYRLAKGHMHEVWATLECPVCGDEMSEVGDDHEFDDNEREWFVDTYACAYCDLMVTYVSPHEYGEYHDVPDSERRYLIEQRS